MTGGGAARPGRSRGYEPTIGAVVNVCTMGQGATEGQAVTGPPGGANRAVV
jgi:hypothetical protein